ncbi:MAG: efflux transporter periplasmic adaptor subunit, partial [Chloroflexi bacterium]|nr:efflux transporter periplasmic adaptor subunit [Chloroflexota bacterium]
VQESRAGKNIVRVSADGQTEERAIVVGISDGLQSEVLSGLSEGDMVIVETRPRSGTGGFLGQ